ncbi:RNA polymerase sigma factor [Conexibacter sp. SYSU D00693]|uniref:RNA polymerase sigma factor n=1 Tax=Conexibacter sp. SYSU D00693 TaxID=2812560 RepID=UPI00196BA886|nr:RNA polymerase sigma factor [Conexibacter sp. SYSU D00693]
MKPFQRFLDEQRDGVWRYLVAAVGRQDADDLFQETFMAAMRAYPREPIANERAWALTIAHRKALDHHRARARRPVPVQDVPEVGVVDGHRVLEEPTWAQVRALPPKQRAAVLLRFAGDLAHAEVAAALGISEEAARRNVHEGLRKLRAEEAALR